MIDIFRCLCEITVLSINVLKLVMKLMRGLMSLRWVPMLVFLTHCQASYVSLMVLNALFHSKCCKTHKRRSSSVTAESPGQKHSDSGNCTDSDSDSDNYSDSDSDSDEEEVKTQSPQVSDMGRKENIETIPVWQKIRKW